MTVEDRGVTLRDFFIFQVKLYLDGGKDLTVSIISAIAMLIDFIAGRGRRPRLFYSVMRASKRFDGWLNLHSSLDRVEGSQMDEPDDRLLGESVEREAGADALLLQFEELAKKGIQSKKPPS